MMESNFAKWLDVTFAGFDGAILEFYHLLAEWCGVILTPFMRVISMMGDKALFLIVLALVLGLFAKTRKTGFCMLLAIICGALMTNVILKETICRMRPYVASDLFREFWTFVGAHAESEFSFPSGHATAAAAAATGLWLVRGKKYLWVSIPFVALMAASRNYFMVHYPTDVIAGAIVGTIGGIIAYLIVLGVCRAMKKHENTKFYQFMVDFDVIRVFINKK